MKTNDSKNTLLLQITILLWSFTSILGKSITLITEQIVWHRMLIAMLCFFIFFKLYNKKFRDNFSHKLKYLAVGCVVAIHWIFFFEAIKVSTISVALVSLSSMTVFTAFLDPLISKKKLFWYEPILGIITMLSIYLIFTFETQYVWGIIFGMLAALTASIFIIYNGLFIKKYNSNPLQMTYYEMIGGFITITCWILIQGEGFSMDWIFPNLEDLVYLLILGIICTAIAFWLGVKVMETISPFTVGIISNLEPVYSIILALLIFGEEELMSIGFYFGSSLLIGGIFLNVFLKKKFKNF